MKKNFKLVLGLILLTALVLRLFKLQELFFFTMDESLIAFRALGLFKYHRPFLIGGGSPLQVHLPPYFYYLASILLFPFNFNPLGWGISGALIGVITVFLLFKLTKKLFNQSTALVASILYATSFTSVFFDRHFWPMSLNPIYTLASMLLLLKLDQKKSWVYFALAGIMVMAITSDPSNIPLILTILTYIFVRRKKLSLTHTYYAGLSALIVFFTPLFLFDIRHQWVNFSAVTKLFEKTSMLSFDYQRLIDALLLVPRSLIRFYHSSQTNLVELHSYCIPFADARQHNLSVILVIFAIGLLIWFIKTTQHTFLKYLLIFYFFGITLFGVLGYSIFDHYLTGLLPIFAIITAFTLSSLPKKLGYLVLASLIMLNLFQISKVNNPYGLKNKQDIVNWSLEKLGDEPFYLDSISKCHRENGLRYLFELTDNPPQQSFMDPNFFWLYQDPPALKTPNKTLLVTDKPFALENQILYQQSFGALNAYIYQSTH
jgi:4-amino-4-deoxy-L-arabinose transferase-like glycosyltransferase